MKLFNLFICILIAILALSGCTSQTSPTKDDWFATTKNARDKLLEYLSLGDRDGIKSLLSENLANKEDIDRDISDSITFFGGKVVSYDNKRSSVDKAGGSKDDGKWTLIVSSGIIFDIHTESGRQLDSLYVSFEPVNTESPEDVGIIAYYIKDTDGNAIEVSLR